MGQAEEASGLGAGRLKRLSDLPTAARIQDDDRIVIVQRNSEGENVDALVTVRALRDAIFKRRRSDSDDGDRV